MEVTPTTSDGIMNPPSTATLGTISRTDQFENGITNAIFNLVDALDTDENQNADQLRRPQQMEQPNVQPNVDLDAIPIDNTNTNNAQNQSNQNATQDQNAQTQAQNTQTQPQNAQTQQNPFGNRVPLVRFPQILNLWRGASLFFIGYFALLLASILLCLLLGWESGDTCRKPLRGFLVVLTCVYGLGMVLTSKVYFSLPRTTFTPNQIHNRVRSVFRWYLIQRLLDFFWFVWAVFGLAWVFSSDCPGVIWNMSLAIGIIHLVLACFVCCGCCYACGHVIMRLGEGQKTPGASKKSIDALKKKKFIKGDVDEEHASCAICLMDFEEGEEIRYLECKHCFHCECVDKWLTINGSCPYCKKTIEKEEPQPPPDGEIQETENMV